MLEDKVMKVVPLSQWVSDFKDFLLIAGPCSAESKEQVLECASQISQLGRVPIFRAGLWKPRTRPNSFVGVGEQGLDWLKTVKKETGLLISTEVACAEHVHLAIESGVDLLWIGARTSTNPFSVQQIADALKNYQIPVMVKNPLSSDLFLWIGALERIANAGIERLVAIHRGFSSIYSRQYRNAPCWKIPLELSTRFPQLPIICDPSHIAGQRNLVAEVSQKAIDRGMKGLMIESHFDPDQALSDAKQQITPMQVGEVIDSLSFKGEFSGDEKFQELINEMRQQIDRIDHEIIESLSARMEVCRRIGVEKGHNDVLPFQMQRLQELMSDRISFGQKSNLDEHLISEVFNAIHAASVKIQSKSLKKL